MFNAGLEGIRQAEANTQVVLSLLSKRCVLRCSRVGGHSTSRGYTSSGCLLLSPKRSMPGCSVKRWKAQNKPGLYRGQRSHATALKSAAAIFCRLAYEGGVVKKQNKKTWYLAMTLGLQQQLCTGATRRQPAGPWRHGDVTLALCVFVRIKLALCVFVSLSYSWLVRHFAHLPTTCTTRGYSGT